MSLCAFLPLLIQHGCSYGKLTEGPIDIKHLPKLQVIGGEPRKCYLYVAIDRASRRVHLAVKDEETEACATAFLKEAVATVPFTITHVLTDRGSCFPDEVVSERLKARPELTNTTYRPPDPCSLTKTKIAAQLKVFRAKEVSQPDMVGAGRRCWHRSPA